MKNNAWIDLQNREISLAGIDSAERGLIDRFQKFASSHGSAEYRNLWMKEVADLYSGRGISRSEIAKSALFRIAQDIGSRQMVRLGEARLPDYRDDLEELIGTQFPSRRAFCEATGISEDMLSHVLARRKHLAISTLTEALNRIGLRLRIVQQSDESVAAS